jgi:hypothetical protein
MRTYQYKSASSSINTILYFFFIHHRSIMHIRIAYILHILVAMFHVAVVVISHCCTCLSEKSISLIPS